MAKVLDCSLEVKEFKLQSRYHGSQASLSYSQVVCGPYLLPYARPKVTLSFSELLLL